MATRCPQCSCQLLAIGDGGSCAWYVQRLNRAASEELDHSLENILSGEQLLLGIRDLRLTLLRYEATQDDYFRRSVRQHISETQKLIGQDVSLRLTSKMTSELEEARTAFEEFAKSATADLELDKEIVQFDAAAIVQLRQQLTSQVLPHADKLLKYFQEEAATNSERNKILARRVGLLLIGLGITGSAAGLLAGFAISRGITRSIDELGGSLLTLRSALDQEDSVPIDQAGRELPALHEAVQDLSQRTETVVRQLHHTRKQAQQSEQLATVGKLAAGFAHEIRNPLTSMKLLVQSANERGTMLEGEQLEILEEEIGRLEKLLQSFLDFARPPRPSRKLLNFVSVVEQTAQVVRARAERQGIEIHCDPSAPELTVYGDGQQLQQVVLNLLLNAMDAQPKGGAIWIELRALNTESANGVELSVADQGVGLPLDLGEQIFEPFVSTKEAGVGLGLSLSQQIVVAHGGTLNAMKRREGGARFTVMLPSEAPIRDETGSDEAHIS